MQEIAPEDPILFYVLALVLLTAFLSIPITLLWRSVFRQLKRNAIKRSTFRADLGIDYYRDKLEGLSPVEISMLTDLGIEPEKDVSALLLKFQMKGILKIDGKKVQVNRPDDPSLLPSEKLLIQAIIDQGELSYALLNNLSEWKSTAFTEVVQGKYIRSNDPNKVREKQLRGCNRGCVSAALTPIVVIVVFLVFGNSAIFRDAYNLIENISDGTTNSELIQMFSKDRTFAMGSILMTLFALFAIFAFSWSIATIIRSTAKASGIAKISRTEEGEQMAEYIYAMKNFLHDFSNLSEASKEHLVLWDDFLIYAVVLEENGQILQDIFSQRSLDLDNIILKRHN